MYINFEQLFKSNISESEFLLLLKIAQKNSELMSENDKESIEKFISLELVELIKTGSSFIDKLRISKKGKQFIRNIESPKYTDEVQYTERELIKLYESYNKDIGLRADVKSRLTWFMSETGFRGDIIKKYVDLYLTEVDPKYVKNLSNLIWTPQSKAFSVTFTLKDSKLFDIITDRMNLNQSVFLDKRDRELNYLFQYGSHKPPKGLDNSLYYTGSYEGDMEHFLKLAEKLTKRVLK